LRFQLRRGDQNKECRSYEGQQACPAGGSPARQHRAAGAWQILNLLFHDLDAIFALLSPCQLHDSYNPFHHFFKSCMVETKVQKECEFGVWHGCGSPRPASGQPNLGLAFLHIRCGEGIILWDVFPA
jgi:hypothetical protein